MIYTLKFWKRFLRLMGFYYLFYGDVVATAIVLFAAEIISIIEEKRKDENGSNWRRTR